MFLAITCLGLKAQNLFVGGSFGVSGYSGELVPGAIDVLELNHSYGIHLRSDFGKVVALKTGIQYFELSANDNNFSSLISYLDRGLSFHNRLWEASAMLEINFLRFGANRTLSAAYLFGGASVYESKLVVQRAGIDVTETTRVVFEDRVLRVQPDLEASSGIAYPVGVGLKIFPSVKSCLELRTGIRLGAGDTLDGVSYEGAVVYDGSSTLTNEAIPGGFKKKNDLYFFAGVAVSIRIL